MPGPVPCVPLNSQTACDDRLKAGPLRESWPAPGFWRGGGPGLPVPELPEPFPVPLTFPKGLSSAFLRPPKTPSSASPGAAWAIYKVFRVFPQGTKGTCTPFLEKSYEKSVQKKDYRKCPSCALSALRRSFRATSLHQHIPVPNILPNAPLPARPGARSCTAQ
jgi:hypothetical protein